MAIFSGIIFCAAFIQTFEFSNKNIEKIIRSRRGVTILASCAFEQAKRYEFISFIKR